ncbi:MAG: hypothetical protein O2984_03275 [Bacteroidetes bacterium]|nr:hypothetical protein [Bacteroidota bacterium]
MILSFSEKENMTSKILLCLTLSLLFCPSVDIQASSSISNAQFRPIPIKKPASPKKSSNPSPIVYSQSAKAGNLVTPAILLGLPTVVILALIFMSLKND